MEISLNDDSAKCGSTAELADKLDEIRGSDQAEVWLSAARGSSICLLKSEENIFLIYLREAGDSGFHSLGAKARAGSFSVRLANGQIDEYPLSWCVEPALHKYSVTDSSFAKGLSFLLCAFASTAGNSFSFPAVDAKAQRKRFKYFIHRFRIFVPSRVEPEAAYRALVYFFEHDGARTPFINWIED